jgi:hypothetical protein
MVLGDRFPEAERLASVRRQLIPWQVIRLFCNFTFPPKEKLLMIAHVAAEVHVFVVNSSIPSFIRSRPDMLRCQVELRKETHGFLRLDSFLDCAQVYSIPAQEIERHLVADMRRIRGSVDPGARSAVIGAIRQSRFLARGLKASLLISLESGTGEEGRRR